MRSGPRNGKRDLSSMHNKALGAPARRRPRPRSAFNMARSTRPSFNCASRDRRAEESETERGLWRRRYENTINVSRTTARRRRLHSSAASRDVQSRGISDGRPCFAGVEHSLRMRRSIVKKPPGRGSPDSISTSTGGRRGLDLIARQIPGALIERRLAKSGPVERQLTPARDARPPSPAMSGDSGT